MAMATVDPIARPPAKARRRQCDQNGRDQHNEVGGSEHGQPQVELVAGVPGCLERSTGWEPENQAGNESP